LILPFTDMMRGFFLDTEWDTELGRSPRGMPRPNLYSFLLIRRQELLRAAA